MKDRIISTLVLTLTEGTKGFVVYCYASRVGLGCLLMKHGKVVVYASITQGALEELSNS